MPFRNGQWVDDQTAASMDRFAEVQRGWGGLHDAFKQSSAYESALNLMNSPRNQGQYQFMYNTPQFLRWKTNYLNSIGQQRQQQMALYNSPAQQQLRMQTALLPMMRRVIPQLQAYRRNLAGISDQLSKQQPPAPPPTTNGPAAATAAPIDYVSSDRLLEGKGYKKFRNQVKGTDQFDAVNRFIHAGQNSFMHPNLGITNYLQGLGRQQGDPYGLAYGVNNPQMYQGLIGKLFNQYFPNL